MNERELLDEALQKAAHECALCDFVWAFGMFRATGYETEQAIFWAQDECDLNPEE